MARARGAHKRPVIIDHNCTAYPPVNLRLRVPPGRRGVRCSRCHKYVGLPRPTKALWRASTHEERVKNRERAERELEKRLTDLKRLTTSIAMWQRRVKYYTREVEKTDEQRAAERAAQEQRRSQRDMPGRRRINL
jgi:hypothetical protein